ncbi:hypothetical protein KP509_26G056600 [Ceratopteris richardii]|uniref:Rab-GAP TBC domain-containing protein n=1 Tax=Ceratopteris richardii TaxID=49495 RepID=A0A8T2RNB1_CERRI|nr:hypothetical protein KP509_26G056600 [Ceratopteris richardii]
MKEILLPDAIEQCSVFMNIIGSDPKTCLQCIHSNHTLIHVASSFRYAELRRRLIVDPYSMEDVQKGENLMINNPLSQDPDSAWGHYFKNTELEKTIENDLTRLYPEHGSFFQGPLCQSLLKRILLVWSLSHTRYGYRQGMHELLAPLVYVLHLDITQLAQVRERYEDPFEDRFNTSCEDNSSINKEGRHGFSSRPTLNFSAENEEWIYKVHPDDLPLIEQDDFGFNLKTILLGSDSYGAEGELGALLSARFMEHDAYSMFNALMEGHNGDIALADYFLSANEGKSSMSPMLEASASLYQTLVAIDTPLYTHLVELGVEPQFFALRWFRILFGREFDLEMLLHLWDAVFAAPYPNIWKGNEAKEPANFPEASTRASFISLFAVSMILYLRSKLLAAPNATVCLQKLLNFPKHVDVRNLIENAKALQMLLKEISSGLRPSLGQHTRFYNRGRTKRHMTRPPSSPSLHLQMSSPISGIQHHSGSQEINNHRRSESYWEQKWIDSVLSDTDDPVSSSKLVNSSSGDKILQNSSVLSNSKENSRLNGFPAQNNTKLTPRRSLFSAFWKGAAQLLTFEEKKSDAATVSVENENCSDCQAADANGLFMVAVETSTSRDGVESLKKDTTDEGIVLLREGQTAGFGIVRASDPEVSEMWASDDGETSSSGDDADKQLHNLSVTSEQYKKTASHPLQEAVCTGICDDIGDSHEGSDHECKDKGDGCVLSEPNEANGSVDDNPGLIASNEKQSRAVLQTLGQSMVESIQVIENAISSLSMDGASAAYRETAENLSKALLNGKGHLTALSALAELRKISSVLLQM